MNDPVSVTVEFYGVPRRRAGRAEVRVTGRTVGEVLAAVGRVCPELSNLVAAGRIDPHYLVSLGGECFVADLHQALRCGDRLLVLSADPGG